MRDLKIIVKLVMREKKDVIYSILFAFLAGISAVAVFASGGYVVSKAALATPLYALVIVTSFLKLAGLLRGASRYAERYFSHRATFTILSDLRVSFYEKLQPLAPNIFQKYRSGDLLSRIVGDVESLQNFFLRVFYPPIILIFVFLATVYFTSFFSIYIALVLLAGLLLTGFIIPALFALRQKKINSEVRNGRGELSTEVTEFLYGFRDLRIYQKLEDKEAQLLDKMNTYIQEQEKEGLHMVSSQAFHTAFSLLISWFVLALGSYLVVAGQLDGLFLAMLVMISLTVFENAAPMAVFPIYFEDSRRAASRLFSVVREQPDKAQLVSESISLPDEAVAIQTDDLTFTFPEENRPVVRDVSINLLAGTKTAIVGPSGSGKSTLLQLLLKIQTGEGKLRIGEIPVERLPQEEIWKNANVVLQENHFFFGSIRSNLLLAAEESSDKELKNVLEKVKLASFSLDDEVLEKGENLSGGEKQRLAIARAMLKDKRLWLLDEPTSSVDALTERFVYEQLFKQAEGDTLILISHRLAGLEQMDRIIVMESGTVIEQGTYGELMEKRGYFYELKLLEKDVFM